MTPAPPAPLEATNPQRADALKRKVLDRIRDVRRHLVALQSAMAGFGEDFDLDFDRHSKSPSRMAALLRLSDFRCLDTRVMAEIPATPDVVSTDVPAAPWLPVYLDGNLLETLAETLDPAGVPGTRRVQVSESGTAAYPGGGGEAAEALCPLSGTATAH